MMSISTRPGVLPIVATIGFRALLLAAVVLVASCFPAPKDDDDGGHPAFVYSVFPFLLGERPQGINEVEVVADISQLLGREVVVRMLMNDQRFVDHWAEVLVDMLEVQREYALTLPAQDGGCWGKTPPGTADPAIARWVRQRGPAEKLTGPDAPKSGWNMTDLLRSAIAIDDISVVYRAYLFPLFTRRASSVNEDKREVLTDRLLRVYLNRDIDCLRCHNPTYSVSNKQDDHGRVVWRRLWAIPGHPEKALFGNYYAAKAVLTRMHPIMRGDVRKEAKKLTDGGILPWGMEKECVKETSDITLKNDEKNLFELRYLGFRKLQSAPGAHEYSKARFGSLNGRQNPKVSLWELEASLHQGIRDLRDGYTRFKAPAKLSEDEKKYCAVVQVFNSSCVGCHSGDKPAGKLDLASDDPAGELVNKGALIRVVPGNLSQSYLWTRINSDTMPMPPSFKLSAKNKDTIKTWILGGAPYTASTSRCNTSHVPDVNPDEGFAFLTAANIVDRLWTAAMGSSLTIDHGYPRNADQRNMLWNLTEFEFIKKGWSLRAVLTKILTSDWFARRSPADSRANSAYTLPPLLDPWVVADPTETVNPIAHQRANGQGALVSRHRVNTLLRMIGKALAWREPNRFPEWPPIVRTRKKQYPDTVDRALGQFHSPKTPGFSDVNFQSLLAFESELGLCDKNGRAAQAKDWIDTLAEEIKQFNKNNPNAPITYGEVWILLKDRLLQDPAIVQTWPRLANERTKEELLMALFGSPPTGRLTDQFDLNVSSYEYENKIRTIRKACGTILKSPQFMLANVAPQSYSGQLPAPPRLTVCMLGEPCTYAQICAYWERTLSTMGHAIACGNRRVYRIPKALPGPVSPLRPRPQSGFPREERSMQPFPWVLSPLPGAGISLPPQPRPDRSFSAAAELDIMAVETAIIDFREGVFADSNLIDPSVGLVGWFTTIDIDWFNKRSWRYAVRKHITALCPTGLCGFLKTAEVASCLTSPGFAACGPLLPTCDPRGGDHTEGVNLCNAPPPDIHDNGVLVAWAEGAVVTNVSAVDIIHPGEWDRTSLQAQPFLAPAISCMSRSMRG